MQHDDMETLSTLLAICERNTPVAVGSLKSSAVSSNKSLNKQSMRRLFRRHDAYVTLS